MIYRITDLINAAKIEQKDIKLMSPSQIKALETLSHVLSNIKCKLVSDEIHPLLKLQDEYSDLAYDDIKKMSIADKKVVVNLLNNFDINLSEDAPSFQDDLYKALWDLGDKTLKLAQDLETNIYQKSLKLIL